MKGCMINTIDIQNDDTPYQSPVFVNNEKERVVYSDRLSLDKYAQRGGVMQLYVGIRDPYPLKATQ